MWKDGKEDQVSISRELLLCEVLVEDDIMDEESLQMVSEMVVILEECREKVFEKFEQYHFDPAYFNLDIDLSVKVDHVIIRVKEQWDAMEVEI